MIDAIEIEEQWIDPAVFRVNNLFDIKSAS